MSGDSDIARAPSPFDVERVRADFPILSTTVHGKPLVYLDNAASTQKPRQVLDSMRRFYESDYANVHRGLYQLSVRATEAFEAARCKVGRFVGAESCGEIVFTSGTTTAINLVAHGYGGDHLGPGDEIVLTEMEHHSNIVPWQMLAGRTGAELRIVPIADDGSLRMDEYERLLGPRTRMVCVAHTSNALGTRNPMRRIIDAAHACGAIVVVDGAQGVPHEKIDVRELDCDFFAFSGHKMFGPTGIGALYGKAELLEKTGPFLGGGEMIHSVTFDETTYKDPPHRFEAGTPDITGAVGLGAAVDYLEQIGMDRVEAYERDLLDYGTRLLEEIPRLTLVGTAAEKCGILSFVIDGVHPHDLGTVLDMEGVAVRAGHHCAQPVMDHFGLAATARASLALYNTREDLDVLAASIPKAIELLG
ncbi:MAG: cysteine desulfurase [bacterium]|nr:cysteine desulfurase [bacterium]